MRSFDFYRCAFAVSCIAFAMASNSNVSLAESLSEVPVNHTTTSKKVVVWATANIPEGSKILDGDLQERVITSAGGPRDSVGCRRLVAGRIAKYAIDYGEIILLPELETLNTKSASNHDFAANCKGASYVVTRRVIQVGARIKIDDLETHWISAMKADPRWLPRAGAVIGLRSTEFVPKGKVLTLDLAERLHGTSVGLQSNTR